MPTSRLDSAAEALRRPGGVISYPTETVYGIGGRASDGASALRIAELKGRAPGGLIVLVDGLPEGLPPLARALAEAFWPGALTLVVPGFEGIAPEVLAQDGTVALRWSPHPTVRALVQAVGPITSTSANRHGEPPCVDGHCSLAVDVQVNEGLLPLAPPSTLVHVGQGRILREGALSQSVAAFIASR
jgi:L-threonylcarbamoyladenylate synthase